MTKKITLLGLVFTTTLMATPFAIVNSSVLKLHHKYEENVIFAKMGELKKYVSIEDDMICFEDNYCTYLKRVVLADTDKILYMKTKKDSCNIYDRPENNSSVFRVTDEHEAIEIVAHLRYGWSMNTDGKYIMTHLLEDISQETMKPKEPKKIIIPSKPKKVRVYEKPEPKPEPKPTPKVAKTEVIDGYINPKLNPQPQKYQPPVKSNFILELEKKLQEVTSESELTKQQVLEVQSSTTIEFISVRKRLQDGETRDKYYISKIKNLEQKITTLQRGINNFNSQQSKLEDMNTKIQKLQQQNDLMLNIINENKGK